MLKLQKKKKNKLSPSVFYKTQIDNYILECSELCVTIKPTSLFCSFKFYNGYVPYSNIMFLINEIVEKKGTEDASNSEKALRVMLQFLFQTIACSFPKDEQSYKLIKDIHKIYIKHNKKLIESLAKKDISNEEMNDLKSFEEAKEIINED